MRTSSNRTIATQFALLALVALAVLLVGCPQNPFWGLEPLPRDDEGPAVTIINPEEGQIVSGSVIVTGVGTDKYAIQSVSIKVDENDPILLEGTYNWYHLLDATILGEGAHNVTIIAVDQFGNTSNTVVNFVVDQSVPSVNPNMDFDAYDHYISGSSYTLEALALDDNGISRVQISFTGGLTFQDLTYNRIENLDITDNGVTDPLDYEVWQLTGIDTAALKPGDGYVEAVLRTIDDSGLIGTTNFPVYVDNTPPTINISYPVTNTTIDASIDLTADILGVTGSVSDNLTDGLQDVKVDIGAYPTRQDIVATVTDTAYLAQDNINAIKDDGPLTITATATDKAGNTAVAIATVSLDDNPPSFDAAFTTTKGTIDGDLSLAANNFKSGLFTISGSGAVGPTDTMPGDVLDINIALVPEAGGTAVVDETVDTMPIDTTGDFSHDLDTSVIPDDTYVLTFTITNTRGGFATESYTIRIDKAGPAATIDSPDDTSSVTGTAVSVSGEATANVAQIASIRIQIDDATVGAGDEIDSTFIAPDFVGITFENGYYAYTWDSTADYSSGDSPQITVTVVDLAGNPASDTIGVSIDPNAPTVGFGTYDHPTNTDYTGKTLITGRAVNGSGTIHGTAEDLWNDYNNTVAGQVEMVEISTDDGVTYTDLGVGPAQTVNWSYVLPGLAEGPQTIVVRVTDSTTPTADTNTSSIDIVVDDTPPVLSNLSALVADTSGTSYWHGEVTVTGTASDASAGVETVSFTVDDPGDANPTPDPLLWDGNDAFTLSWQTEALPTDGVNPTTAAAGVELVVLVTDAAGNTHSTTETNDIRPYISGLLKDYAYLGETGLEIYGHNFSNGVDNPIVKVGGGRFDNNDGGLITVTANLIEFDIDSNFPPLDTALSSGDVTVEFNGVDNSSQAEVEMDLFNTRIIPTTEDPSYPDAVYDTTNGKILFTYAKNGGNPKESYFIEEGSTDQNVESALSGAVMYDKIAWGVDPVAPGTNPDLTYVTYVDNSGLAVEMSDDGFVSQTKYGPFADASFNDIVVDSTGVAHLVYYDSALGRLYYRTSADGFAAATQIDGATYDAGEWVSMAVDSNDGLHVVYRDADNDDLKYLYYNGSWRVPRSVDDSDAGDFGNGVATDSLGGIHVSYYNGTNGDLMYAYAADSTADFQTEIVDSVGVTGWFPSIAVDDNDDPHVTYGSLSSLKPKYARVLAGEWVVVTIGEDFDFDINANSNSTATLLVGTRVHMIYVNTNAELRDAVYLPED